MSEAKVKVVREDQYSTWIERRCQLPRGVTTVRHAHEVLRAPEVSRAEGKTARQGEWFFLDVVRGRRPRWPPPLFASEGAFGTASEGAFRVRHSAATH